MANRGGFSWKRAAGISKAKSKISRATGVPLTKSGRQRKVGKAVSGGCCLLPALAMVSVSVLVITGIVMLFI